MAPNASRIAGPAAFLTAGALFATQVGGRATRDALFLSIFPITALPSMIMVTAVLALALAFLSTRAMVRWGPAIVMPAAFTLSAMLLLAEWGISSFAPAAAAVLVYLHFGGLGALLISGFWSFLNERLDPRSAKRQLGQVNAAGTLGGLAGGLAAAELARILPVPAMLPVLAGIQLVCAAGMLRLRGAEGRAASARAASARAASARAASARAADVGASDARASGARGADARTADARSSTARAADAREQATTPAGLRALVSMPYIKSLISLVVILTIADVLIDLLLKGRAANAIPHGPGLLRFFAAFYTGISLLIFVVQAFLSRFVLERLGPARAAALLPAGAAAGAAGALVVPGLGSAVVARGAQSVLMASLFNAGYEVLFTPVPARDKRAIKSLVDVGGSRAGDLLGAAIAQGIVFLALPAKGSIVLALAIVLSVVAFWIALRLQRGYVQALARGLVTRAVHLELSEATDSITRSTLMRTLQISRPVEAVRQGTASRQGRTGTAGATTATTPGPPPEEETEEARRSRALRSRNPEIVQRALAEGPLQGALLPQVVSLLAWDPVARDAIAALRRAGPAALQAVVDPLLDPDSEFTIRRRVPLVLGTIADPLAIQGLLLSLTDKRFEVRYRSGLALAHLLAIDPTLSVPPDVAFAAVRREVETASGVWEGRTLLDKMDDEAWSPVMDELVRERADRSLEHVFTLLALVLPRKPLRIAFRGLHTGDPLLRGTALEYLETTLPPEIRKPLWPFLEPDRARRAPRAHPAGDALNELLRMNDSIVIRLEELRRKE